jgi:arylsulfatase A-like enzyme
MLNRRILPLTLLASALAAATLLDTTPERASGAPAERPNIVVVMTDDQDARTLDPLPGLPPFDSPCSAPQGTVMPCLHELVRERGVTFDRHVAAFPLCCPSRATYITGQYPHNHTVRGNFQYANLDKERILPVWLQQAGYATAYAGKYQGPLFVPYGDPSHPDGRPKGWDRFWGLIDAAAGVSAYNFFNYVIDADGVPEPYGSADADYQTDVLTRKATGFIEGQEAEDGKPFFLSVGYVGPHWANPPDTANDPDIPAAGEGDPNFEATQIPPVPAPRHLDELERFRKAGLKAVRTPAFNEEDVSDKPKAVRDLPRLTEREIARIDRWYHRRLASLLSIDEGVKAIVDTLRRTGELDNTYFLFTADNGWLEGQHRLAFQKQHPYEESSRLPMLVSGPRVARAATVQEPTSNVDVAATVVGLAGAAPTAGFDLDGVDLSPYLRSPGRRVGRAVFQETTDGPGGYAGVRTERWRYVEHGTGERELYDLREDPAELRSRHDDPSLREVRERLARLVADFRTCRGASCVRTDPRPSPPAAPASPASPGSGSTKPGKPRPQRRRLVRDGRDSRGPVDIRSVTVQRGRFVIETYGRLRRGLPRPWVEVRERGRWRRVGGGRVTGPRRLEYRAAGAGRLTWRVRVGARGRIWDTARR